MTNSTVGAAALLFLQPALTEMPTQLAAQYHLTARSMDAFLRLGVK